MEAEFALSSSKFEHELALNTARDENQEMAKDIAGYLKEIEQLKLEVQQLKLEVKNLEDTTEARIAQVRMGSE